jgi:hypothetical protein
MHRPEYARKVGAAGFAQKLASPAVPFAVGNVDSVGLFFHPLDRVADVLDRAVLNVELDSGGPEKSTLQRLGQ